MNKYFMIFIGIVCFIGVFMSKPSIPEEPQPENVEVQLEQPEFFLEDKPTRELILQACEYYNIHHSDIVVAQAILETGHFRSENCKVNNNLFGLFNSKKKEYFKFDHWTSCVKAYRDMIQYKYKEDEDYYKFLTRIGYAEDPNYIIKIKGIVERYE
jgi:flagellum-specific peptidoglycan hydrolase FlgJ